MNLIPGRTIHILIEVILRFVKKESIIYTNCWKGYSKVKNYFQHKTVNHSKNFKDSITDIHANTIEGNRDHLKNTFQPDGEQKKTLHCRVLWNE